MDVSSIGVKEILPWAALEGRLRKVGIVGSEQIPRKDRGVYKRTLIESEAVRPEELNLTTEYLVRETVLFQEKLRERLHKDAGIDTLNLSGLAILETPDGEVVLAPPIVEQGKYFLACPQQIERGCSKLSLPVLIDGGHRAYLGLRNGEEILIAKVSGVDELFQVPIVPNGWNDVMIVDRIPSRQFKKRYLGESFWLYRDLSALGSKGYREGGR
ncbi:MAG: hypothetical protein V1820_00330 [archaeon]